MTLPYGLYLTHFPGGPLSRARAINPQEKTSEEKEEIAALLAKSAEFAAQTRVEAEEIKRIKVADVVELFDRVLFNHQNLTLDEMKSQAAQWCFRDDLVNILLSWPERTSVEVELARAELKKWLDTEDVLHRAAVRRLWQLIGI